MDGGHVEKTRQKPSHSKMRCACSSRSICSGTAGTDGQRCTQVEKTKSENGSRSGEHPGHRLQDRHGLLLTSYKNQLHGPCQPRAAAHAPQQQAGQGSASCFFLLLRDESTVAGVAVALAAARTLSSDDHNQGKPQKAPAEPSPLIFIRPWRRRGRLGIESTSWTAAE